MINYYEILEVSQKASKEVIEKAYKALVKKYHPDLQPNNKKAEAEKKIKLINEAYDILSDDIKKESYDNKLYEYQARQQQQQQQSSQHSNTNINNSYTKKSVSTDNNKLQDDLKIKEYYNNYYKKAYNDAYIKNLKNMGYTIRYKKSFKQHLINFISAIIAISLLIIMLYALWHIPSTRKYFLDLYSNNYIIKLFVDSI